MKTRPLRLAGIARNVSDLAAAEEFYREALGFKTLGPVRDDPALARALGLQNIQILTMGLGDQILELSSCEPRGAPYPLSRRADDPWFQHIAIVTSDIAAAYARVMAHQAVPISHEGPVTLPASSGGVTAFKFRDPEGHALELIEFPKGGAWQSTASLTLGIDHSAIRIGEVYRSIGFYERLGLSCISRQINQDRAQDRLDGLEHVTVDVIALKPGGAPTPHVELLRYRHQSRRHAKTHPAANDIAADRLVFLSDDDAVVAMSDPDGHRLVLDGRR